MLTRTYTRGRNGAGIVGAIAQFGTTGSRVPRENSVRSVLAVEGRARGVPANIGVVGTHGILHKGLNGIHLWLMCPSRW